MAARRLSGVRLTQTSGTTFTANSAMGAMDFSSGQLLSGDRLDAIELVVTAKLTSGGATEIKINSADEYEDLVSALVGNITVRTPGYAANLCQDVSANNVIKAGILRGWASPSNLPHFGHGRAVETTGEFDLQLSIMVPIARPFPSNGGIRHAAYGAFLSDAQIAIIFGDGSCSLNSVTWSVDTTAGAFEVNPLARGARGAGPIIKAPIPVIRERNLASNGLFYTADGAHLAIAQTVNSPAALGGDLNDNNGIAVTGSNYSVSPDQYNPLAAAHALYQDVGLAAELGLLTQKSGTAAGDIAGPASLNIVPIHYIPASTTAEAGAAQGKLRIEFKTSYATSGVGGIVDVYLAEPTSRVGQTKDCPCIDGPPAWATSVPGMGKFAGQRE